MATDWEYMAGRITGDGRIDIVANELPININSITRNLSAPSAMAGSIDSALARLRSGGRPIFEPWNTVIVAVADDQIRGLTIYRQPTFTESRWALDQIGLTGYALGMPYDGEATFIATDPLDIFRHIWTHLQSQPNGNLGITIDGTGSPVRLGTEAQGTTPPATEAAQLILDRMNSDQDIFEDWTWRGAPTVVGDWNDHLLGLWDRSLDPVVWLQRYITEHPKSVNFTTGAGEDVSFEAGPRRLNGWSTTDLGREIDSYAKETPFDWLETYDWVGDSPHCHVRLGYPQLGGRKDHMRLVLGENLATQPTVSTAPFLNAVYVLGAGEGRDAVRGYAGVSDGRLRRATTITDRDIESAQEANELARRMLAASRGELIVEQLEVYDHPNAPLEAVELGDELPLYAETDWVEVDQWVRLVGRTDAPGQRDKAIFTVARPGVVV